MQARVRSSEIVERNFDGFVQRNIFEHTDPQGRTRTRTSRFVLLENNMFYQEAGEWKESEDLLEPSPEGAIARRGPNRAAFSSRLASQDVFDIRTRSGTRIRGGLRLLLATDSRLGKSVVLAHIKEAATGRLAPPNTLIFADAFEELQGSVYFVWKHNLFCQDVLFSERPPLPEGFDEATTRLEIVTEFIDASPTISALGTDESTSPNHTTISFGDLAIVTAHAFPADKDKLGYIGSDPQFSPVMKEWVRLPGGKSYLIESVPWGQLATADLPFCKPRRARRASRWETLASIRPSAELASAPVELTAFLNPRGYMIDFTMLPDNPLTTRFASGTTYYIPKSYYSGAPTEFEPGAVIKYRNNAYMLLYGPITFPVTLQTPVLTSREDDSFGEPIIQVPHETEAPHREPKNHKAAQALWIYYVTFNTTISSLQVRWAKRGIQYDANPGHPTAHNLNDSAFEDCDIGIYANLANGLLNISRSTKQLVANPISAVSGSVHGTLTPVPFYLGTAFAGIDIHEPNTIDWPDTMGGVGPNYIVELVNRKIAVFDRSANTKRVREASLAQFFSVTFGGIVYPRAGYFLGDIRIVYDPLSHRWIACALEIKDLESGDNRVLLAVSHDADPVPLNTAPDLADTSWIATKWTKYIVDLAEVAMLGDYPSLGVDRNGIYIAISCFPTEGGEEKTVVIALPKGPFISNPPTAATIQPENPAHRFDVDLANGEKNVRPVMSFEPTAAGNVAWFVSAAEPYGGRPGGTTFGQLRWNPASQVFEKQAWFDTVIPVPAELNYWDIPAEPSFYAPQKPKTYMSSTGPILYSDGFRLSNDGTHVMSAVLRNGYLWICQHVGTDSSGGYSGTADRSAVVWFKLKVETNAEPLTLVHSAHGLIYDSHPQHPYWFSFPTLMVNKADDVAIGFNGSRDTEYMGAFFWGQRAAGAVTDRPRLIQAGRDHFRTAISSHGDPQFRWGDYSMTALDPRDEMTIYTFQEYAMPWDDFSDSNWGTWIAAINLGPKTTP